MAQTPEKKVKDKVVKILKSYDAYYFFPATHGFGRSGVPDVVCCVLGKFIAIECKAGNNQPTALQQREIEAIKQVGGVAFVINEDNLTMLGDFLKELTENESGYQNTNS
jgi:Holliday junction resolvase